MECLCRLLVWFVPSTTNPRGIAVVFLLEAWPFRLGGPKSGSGSNLIRGALTGGEVG